MDTLLPNCPLFVFDGKNNFETWYQQMKKFLKTIELWSTIDEGFEELLEGTPLTGDATMQLEKKRYLDYKARYYLAIKVKLHVYKKCLHAKSSKEAWKILVKSYRKVAYIKKEKLQEFRSQFELARMRPTESIKEFFTRIEEIVDGLRTNGEVLEKLDDLKGKLVTYERSLNQQKDETLEDASQEKGYQSNKKEDTLKMKKINQEGQNSEIEEKRREGACNFCCDRNYIECKGKSNNIQIDLSKIHSIVKKEDLVGRDVRPKEVGVSPEKVFDGIEDESNNERSKMVHHEKFSNDLSKFETK
ncbi:uncharacterized protein [Nicotiana sylvestris]|uniref:uncharacterized protein n=1 Tax=Nicotiana sylvestris TaxID=4096 RepID=UPI00388CEA38